MFLEEVFKVKVSAVVVYLLLMVKPLFQALGQIDFVCFYRSSVIWLLKDRRNLYGNRITAMVTSIATKKLERSIRKNIKEIFWSSDFWDFEENRSTRNDLLLGTDMYTPHE